MLKCCGTMVHAPRSHCDESEPGKVQYIVPESLIEYLDPVGEPPKPTEQMVRGYKVRTLQQMVDPKEAVARLIRNAKAYWKYCEHRDQC